MFIVYFSLLLIDKNGMKEGALYLNLNWYPKFYNHVILPTLWVKNFHSILIIWFQISNVKYFQPIIKV